MIDLRGYAREAKRYGGKVTWRDLVPVAIYKLLHPRHKLK